MTFLSLLKFDGINPVTGVQLPMATGCSEGTGEAGRTKVLPFISRNG